MIHGDLWQNFYIGPNIRYTGAYPQLGRVLLWLFPKLRRNLAQATGLMDEPL